jgi:adenosylhomocysteine nucleosidase
MNKDIQVISALVVEWGNEIEEYVSFSGVGKINATIKTLEVIEKYKPKMIINYGTAGSTKGVTGLVDCTKFVQRDIDAEALGFSKTITPYESSVPQTINFSKVKNPINKKMSCGTGDSFVTSNEGITTDVVDMEAYAIAKVCYLNNIDFISFKYITDDGDAEDWKKNCYKGVEEFKKVLKYYV